MAVRTDSIRPIINEFESNRIGMHSALTKLQGAIVRNQGGSAGSETSLEDAYLTPERIRALRAEVLRPLDDLVGLSGVKSVIESIFAHVMVQRMREDVNLIYDRTVDHMAFTGNPGTGKTTVARMLGQIFANLHILTSGHVVEVERADLVGEYVGHTAQKTRAALQKALGGILFVDEAYALARGGERDFGREAIDTLVKGMEDHRGELIVVIAGYEREMQHFLSLNPGMHSRFPIHVHFADFTDIELTEIAYRIAKDRDYKLTPSAVQALRRMLAKERTMSTFGNARTVRNIMEAAMRDQAARVINLEYPTRDDLMKVEAVDVFGGGESAPWSGSGSTQRW